MTKKAKLIGFTPHSGQVPIIRSILFGPEKFHAAAIGRQFGKSLMGENLAAYWLINHKPCKVLWVAPVYSQTRKVHKEMYQAMNRSGIIASNNFTENEMVLHTGSSIYYRSAERYDNIRSWTYDYAIIDEAAFMKKEAWQEAIRPTLAVRGKKVVFLSTPKGRNWFFDIHALGMSSDHPNYKSYKGSSMDSPFMDPGEIADAQRTLPEQIFRQEYLAEFIDDGGAVFSNYKRLYFEQYPQPQGQVYAALDLGKQMDYTVLTLMDQAGQVVEIYRANSTQWKPIIEKVVEICSKYSAMLLVEVNGIGDPIFEQLESLYHNIEPFITTNRSKNEIVEGLILDIQEGNVSLPSRDLFPALSEELETFTFEYNPKTRSLTPLSFAMVL